ncbi:glycosyltransferase [Brevibacterium album]|uniref:glycosyltransferase n=1 Tax=Brevibacterium album TaxID=417948 RepID=UPI00041BB085|nr:glycosyltransferase [Brevibacterium album]
MASFLFLTWNGGGAALPVLVLADELCRRGHRVRVLGHAVQASQFAARGVPFSPYPHAGGFEVTASPLNLLALMRDRDAARDVADELDARPADLVVGDALLLSTLTVLLRRKQRYALLESTADSLMHGRLRRLDGALRLLGLPVRAVLEGARLVVVASAAEIDPQADSDAEHIGPMVQAVAAHPSEPALLMSLSTFPFPRLTRTWQHLLDAAAGLPIRAVATTGPSLAPTALKAPQNVELRAWADHAALMPAVSAAVTHGGHGTTVAALAHGLPVLVLPLDAASDQPGIGRLVEEAGVGLTLSRRASARRLHGAFDRLLHDEGLRERSHALGERIREYGGARAGADALVRAAG